MAVERAPQLLRAYTTVEPAPDHIGFMMIVMKLKKDKACQAQSGLRANAVNLFEEYHVSRQPDLGLSL